MNFANTLALSGTDAVELILIIAVVLIAICVPTFIIIRKKKRLRCSNCKERLSYENIVKAVEGETHVIGISGNGIALTDVHVWLKCPECGEIKDFVIKFKSGERTEGDVYASTKIYDLDDKLRKYFD